MKPRYKPIPSESNLFKVEFQNTSEVFDYPWHYHPELEITYILNGKGVRYVGNTIENFYEDDLVLLGSNLPHAWNHTADPSQQVIAIVIYLKEEFLDKTWMHSIEFETVRKLLEAMRKGIKIDTHVASRLKPKFIDLLNASSFERLMILLQILHELSLNTEFRYLCEQEFMVDLNFNDKERINAVYKYIQANYKRQISLADIASRLNMTEEYFSRFFSKTMKKPFFEFLNEYKINRACKLLIETDKQVSEVCYASGFESLPFFYRQFKKFKNCQPKNYRQDYQKISF
ncbi:AraC family transcriptional regulator [Chitinophaga sp. YIM B06452]|uniref:AraC family transcriptional regulator n=1 Tax=Chitinophaga sp. YIM B06452 TaxID=3082158 RepID=UPI0031FF1A91